MTYFEAYLFTRLDSLLTLSFALIITGTIMSALFTIIWKAGEEESAKPFTIVGYVLLTIGLIINLITPTTKEAAFIYIAPAIVNNQDVQKTIKQLPELSGLGLEYLGEILKEEIKETKKEVINK